MEYTSRGGDRGRDELRDDGPGVAGHTFKYHVKQDALVWLKVQDDHESQVPGGLTLHASHSKDLPVRVVHHRSKNLGFVFMVEYQPEFKSQNGKEIKGISEEEKEALQVEE